MEKQQFKAKIGKKIVSSLVTLLLVCTVFLCFSVVMQVLNRGYASIGGYSLFRVVTGSMEPEIFAGELIASKSVDIDTLEVGDVICFRSKSPQMLGRSITHRVIGRSVDTEGNVQLLTKGDANLSVDEYYVTQDNLIGVVVWQSHTDSFLSDFVGFFSNKISFLACIALPCLLIAGLIFRDCVKNVKQDIAKAMQELLENEGQATALELDPTEEEATPRILESETEEQPSDSQSQKEETADRVSMEMDPREYEEMYARIRAELIEELKQENDREQTKS
jgi:signal peptidase